MDEQSANLFHGYGQMLRCRSVERFHNFSGGLCCVYIGPCGTVDDTFHIVVTDHFAHGFEIGDVEFLIVVAHIGKDVVVFAPFGRKLQLVAQLSVGPCN